MWRLGAAIFLVIPVFSFSGSTLPFAAGPNFLEVSTRTPRWDLYPVVVSPA